MPNANMPHSQCEHAQCEHAPCPIPHAQFPMPQSSLSGYLGSFALDRCRSCLF
ncbi:MAG: hypothetical protein F6J93_32215 [Oscillatoria sp. SIO1A7]|nr:hypothetical protein [Oscillatoria sp. SIO1A7]